MSKAATHIIGGGTVRVLKRETVFVLGEGRCCAHSRFSAKTSCKGNMTSPKLSIGGAMFLLTALLHACAVQSASLWQNKLRGNELEGSHPNPYLLPNTDMVKALEYIESLRQQSHGDEGPSPDYDGANKLHPLAAIQKQEESDRNDATGWQDNKSQQLLKALVRTLQNAGKEPKVLPAPSNSHYRQPEEDDDSQAGNGADYEGNPWPQNSKTPRKYPLMFEDEDSKESPFKRTNENLEEKYTPQSLATLQSVFEELGKLAAPKGQKRQSLDEDQRFYKGDDDEIYRLNNLAYEDVTGGEDWTPVEEKVDTEEVVNRSQEEFDGGSNEKDSNSMKRSSQPANYEEEEEPDDVTKLVDYYLLKILEKTEQTEHKRDREQEQSTDKRLAQASYNVDPQAIYQLIEISRKLQIPPEDIIEMLKNGEIKTQNKIMEPEEDTESPDDLDKEEVELSPISFYNKDKSPSTKFYNRRLPEVQENDIPDDINTEDILNILGLENLDNQKTKYLLKQRHSKNTPDRYYAPSGRRGDFKFSEPSISDKRNSDYDDAVYEDELASYLAAKMLAQYPKVVNKIDLKRSTQPSPKEQPLDFGTLMLDYIDQMAADKNLQSKRLSETEDMGDSPTTQRLDDDTLLKMLGYLNPETGENEGTDLYGKTVDGM